MRPGPKHCIAFSEALAGYDGELGSVYSKARRTLQRGLGLECVRVLVELKGASASLLDDFVTACSQGRARERWVYELLWSTRPQKMKDVVVTSLWLRRYNSRCRSAMVLLLSTCPKPVCFSKSLSATAADFLHELCGPKRSVNLLKAWVDAFGVDAEFVEQLTILETGLYALLARDDATATTFHSWDRSGEFFKYCIELRPRLHPRLCCV
jgi:hypothetical protein